MPQELDPVRYEIFRHRLFNILEEGRIAIKMVSGSPVVVEGGETMCCFCDQQGNSILIAAGILLHAFGASDFVRKAIEWYSDDPGFADGDQLFFNDPYIGGQHLADQVIIKPVFYQGNLVAWVGSIMHTPETGGMEPGGNTSKATEIFQEGFRIVGLKIVEAGRFRKDVYNSLLAQARDPHLLALDTKAKIAANNTCARGYLQLIQRFGFDFVQAAGQRLIRDSEKMARAKLKSLPDGIWRSRLYGDATGGSRNKPYRLVCTMTKEGDNITFDFTGSSPQNEGSMNCTLPATWGQLFVPLTSQLFWDVPWNAGVIAPVRLIAPEGTVVNCRFPQACSRGVTTVGSLLEEVAHECIAKMLYAGGIYEDVTSGWKGGVLGRPGFGGLNQYGDVCGGGILDGFASGTGASPFKDGVDTGGNMMNPQSCISDVEIIELNIPFMYLSRRQATDSGGFGKFSGGMASQAIYMVYGTDDFQVCVHRHGRKTTGNFGIFGGYPSTFLDTLMVLNPGVSERFQRSQVPAGFEDMELLGGEVVNPPGPERIPFTPVKQYDLVLLRMGAGGGYGDPLDRHPSLVLADIQRLAISTETAARVYGVIVDPKTMKLNLAATKNKRQSTIQERLREGRRSRPSIKKEALPTGKARTLLRMHEYLEIASVDGTKVVRCLKCGHIFCRAEENYKEYALLRERDLSEIPLRSLTSKEPIWVLFQEYICPGCGTLLEVDNVCPQLDSPEEWILWDIQLKLS